VHKFRRAPWQRVGEKSGLVEPVVEPAPEPARDPSPPVTGLGGHGHGLGLGLETSRPGGLERRLGDRLGFE